MVGTGTVGVTVLNTVDEGVVLVVVRVSAGCENEIWVSDCDWDDGPEACRGSC